ncbi:MAG TPA: hypothetical protein DEV81_02475 [Cyanobacteria bacterium UBA11049]|nr:hypothetical protein [Cyanobacteria bacterium UBA11049]
MHGQIEASGTLTSHITIIYPLSAVTPQFDKVNYNSLQTFADAIARSSSLFCLGEVNLNMSGNIFPLNQLVLDVRKIKMSIKKY